MSGAFHPISFCRCHVAPRGQQNVPSEPSFPIPLKKSDVVRQTKTHLETLEERIIDVFWNVTGGLDRFR